MRLVKLVHQFGMKGRIVAEVRRVGSNIWRKPRMSMRHFAGDDGFRNG